MRRHQLGISVACGERRNVVMASYAEPYAPVKRYRCLLRVMATQARIAYAASSVTALRNVVEEAKAWSIRCC